MPDINEVVDRLHYENRQEYTVKRGNIAYLDGTPLTRPSSMPMAQRFIAIGIVVVALLIAFALVNNFVISRIQESQATEKAIADNLARPASIESIPNMQSLSNLDNDAIRAQFADAGYTMYDQSARDESNDLVLYRVPADVKVDDVAAAYLQGMNSLSAVDASKLFVGGWYFAADHSNGTSMVVRYVDFSTADPQIAVQNAITKEGFDKATITESGEDESGNTYSMGTCVVDGDVVCTWKVSALPLEDVYSISGLPKNACYVGVRISKA